MNLSTRTSRLLMALALGIALFVAPVAAHHATPAPESTPWYLPPGAPLPPSHATH